MTTEQPLEQTEQPDVSVVIVSFNTKDLTRKCIRTLERESEGVSVELIVVDNASRDGSADMLAEEFPYAKLILSDENLGFAGANNRGFDVATGRYIVLLNSDAFLKPGALYLSVQKMDANPRCGLAGGLLVGQDDSWQPSARMFPSVLNDFLTLTGLSARFPQSKLFGRVDRTWADPNESAKVDWVPGAYSILRKDVLEKVGYFDERYFLYFEEVDLCKRIKEAGYDIWYWPDIVVMHIGGESSKTVEHITMSSAGAQLTLWRMRSAMLYYRMHHGVVGAWAAMSLEKYWHRVRTCRNRMSSEGERQAKAEESSAIASLLNQAWGETCGGRVSPPRPW